MISKRGQVALWFIIGVVIVALIGLLLVFNKKPTQIAQEDLSPQAFIDACMRESIIDTVDLMLPRGGFVEPKNYKLYKNTTVAYLCENTGYFYPCINQHPAFINELRQEIYTNTYERINGCFMDLKASLEARNYQVKQGQMNMSIILAPQKIIVQLSRPMEITYKGEVTSYEDFSIDIYSHLYELANVANEIASQEAKYCYFEYVGYMLLYPQFDIQKYAFSDSTKIYTIKHNPTQKEMNIAVRSCAIPPGL